MHSLGTLSARPTITLRDVPSDLHRGLKAQAARNHRSLNREVIQCLATVVYEAEPDEHALLVRIQQRRAALREHGLW